MGLFEINPIDCLIVYLSFLWFCVWAVLLGCCGFFSCFLGDFYCFDILVTPSVGFLLRLTLFILGVCFAMSFFFPIGSRWLFLLLRSCCCGVSLFIVGVILKVERSVSWRLWSSSPFVFGCYFCLFIFVATIYFSGVMNLHDVCSSLSIDWILVLLRTCNRFLHQ